jgi:hypothetical protein
VVSKLALNLHPALTVTAHLDGTPEVSGYLELGLTLDDTVIGGENPCSQIEGPQPIFAIRQLGSPAGYQLHAFYSGTDVGSSPVVSGGDLHEASFVIGSDGRVEYRLDGQTFARSPADQPLPSSGLVTHLVLDGIGQSARFSDVSVIDGTQCDSPGSFTPATPFVALAPSEDSLAWDRESVFNPRVTSTSDGNVILYYTGCGASLSGSGCGPQLGIGRALSHADQPFVRDPVPHEAAAVFVDLWFTPMTSTLTSVDDPVTGYISKVWGVADWDIHLANDLPTQPVALLDQDSSAESRSNHRLSVAPSGAWDDETICCASVLERAGKQLLWYAGQHTGDPVWRIGFATSTDGGTTFQRAGAGPVLKEGAPTDVDSRGVKDPMVVFDEARQLYRMWYRAEALFGVSSIGYAVSTDGITWHKFPENPVVSGKDVGLQSVGGPTVLVEPGQTRMWIHGSLPSETGQNIYVLTNRGQPPQ